MSDTCVPSVIVIDIAINQLETKASLKTMLPEAIGCCLQTSTYCCFYQGSEIYMYIHFHSQNFYAFELYGHMYCYYNVLPEAIFDVYRNFFGDLPATNICMSLCKISSLVVLWF